MPAKSSSRLLSLRIRLRRSSVLTGRTRYSARRNSPIVDGAWDIASQAYTGTAARLSWPISAAVRSAVERLAGGGDEAARKLLFLAEVEVDEGRRAASGSVQPSQPSGSPSQSCIVYAGLRQSPPGSRLAEVELVAAEASAGGAQHRRGGDAEVAIAAVQGAGFERDVDREQPGHLVGLAVARPERACRGTGVRILLRRRER